jgi:DNA-directed RNA polymerase subunit RPC12/RpoP
MNKVVAVKSGYWLTSFKCFYVHDEDPAKGVSRKRVIPVMRRGEVREVVCPCGTEYTISLCMDCGSKLHLTDDHLETPESWACPKCWKEREARWNRKRAPKIKFVSMPASGKRR